MKLGLTFIHCIYGRVVIGQHAVEQVAESHGKIYHELHIGAINITMFKNIMYNVSVNLQDFKITFLMDNTTKLTIL